MYQTSGPMAASTTMINPVTTPLMTDPHYHPSSTAPTPPPSASSVDLPPIPALSSYGRHLPLGDGPLSPASPQKQKGSLPAYLEPTPQVNQLMSSTFKIRPQLFHLLAPPLVSFPARRATAPTLTHHHSSLYSSLPPRRSHSQSMDPIRSTTIIDNAPPYLSPSPTTLHQLHHHQQHNYRQNTNYSNNNNNQSLHHNNAKKRKSCHLTPSAPLYPFQGQDLCTSPTLTAACASAANLHTSTSSTSSLGSVSTSASPSSSPSSITTPSDISSHQDHPHHIRSKSDEDKKQMDQSMFLTKNAHIKRPRNAWIHFRCHYGQALKTQDPTLRAEEISKRASRRWSLLSENEKRPWHQMAEQEKQAHKEAFPEYRYCPKRATTITTSPPPSSVHPTSTPSFTQQGSYRLPSTDLDPMVKKSKKV